MLHCQTRGSNAGAKVLSSLAKGIVLIVAGFLSSGETGWPIF